MGMFDYIKLKIDCPSCGARVTSFQSKDGPCYLTELNYWEVDNFYTSCGKCNLWIEYVRKSSKTKVPLSDFKLIKELQCPH